MISIYFPFSNLIGEKEKPKALMYQGFRLWQRTVILIETLKGGATSV